MTELIIQLGWLAYRTVRRRVIGRWFSWGFNGSAVAGDKLWRKLSYIIVKLDLHFQDIDLLQESRRQITNDPSDLSSRSYS